MTRAVAWIAAALLIGAAPASAGVYSTADPFPFVWDDSALAQPLAYTNFKLLMVEWLSVPAPAGAALRQSLEGQVRDLGKKDPNQLTQEELATRSAAMIRLRKYDDAFNLLMTASRNRTQNGFFVQVHLAHLHYLRGEYREAAENQYSALKDFPAPTKFGTLKPEHLAWLISLETECILPLYRLRRDEAKQRGSDVAETPDEIFPFQNPRSKRPVVKPLDWHYGPSGKPTRDEMVKPPNDAFARVQQLLLNNPGDTRLYWLLGELHQLHDQTDIALRIFDECVDAPRNYTSPLLMEHRQILRRLLETKAEEQKAAEAKKEQQGKSITLWIGIGCGVAIALFFAVQIRSFARRMRR